MESKFEHPIFAEAVYDFCTRNMEYFLQRQLEPISMLEYVVYYKQEEFEEWIREPKNGHSWLVIAL